MGEQDGCLGWGGFAAGCAQGSCKLWLATERGKCRSAHVELLASVRRRTLGAKRSVCTEADWCCFFPGRGVDVTRVRHGSRTNAANCFPSNVHPDTWQSSYC